MFVGTWLVYMRGGGHWERMRPNAAKHWGKCSGQLKISDEEEKKNRMASTCSSLLVNSNVEIHKVFWIIALKLFLVLRSGDSSKIIGRPYAIHLTVLCCHRTSSPPTHLGGQVNRPLSVPSYSPFPSHTPASPVRAAPLLRVVCKLWALRKQNLPLRLFYVVCHASRALFFSWRMLEGQDTK